MDDKTKEMIKQAVAEQLRFDILKKYPQSVEILKIMREVIDQNIENLAQNPPAEGSNDKSYDEIIDELMKNFHLGIEDIVVNKVKSFLRIGINFASDKLKDLAKKVE